jgi:hypothetical protein
MYFFHEPYAHKYLGAVRLARSGIFLPLVRKRVGFTFRVPPPGGAVFRDLGLGKGFGRVEIYGGCFSRKMKIFTRDGLPTRYRPDNPHGMGIG